MKTRLRLLAGLSLALFVSAAFGQGGPPTSASIHRTLSSLEAELLAIVDKKEELLNATAIRNTRINELTLERNRAQGADRDRISQQIEKNSADNRAASVETGRLNLESERIRIEIDRLMRFDAQLNAGAKGGGRAPQIRAINVVKRDRKGPMQVPGQGRGFQESTTYEVVFSDGSRQRVESISFAPQR